MYSILTEKEIKHAKKTKRLPYNLDFWSNAVVGTIVFGGTFFGIGMAILTDLQLIDKLGWPYFFIILIAFGLIFKSDHRIRDVQNLYAKETNIKKVRECLTGLGWEYWTIKGVIYIGANKFFLHFIHATIIPVENGILYNFQYSDSRGVRPPFFFGIRTFVRKKFEKKLQITLACQKQG